MRLIKFRYFWQHDETGRMTSRELTLGDITCGTVDMWTEKIGYGIPVVTGLQWTGLTDKKGVEIYEGDILAVSDDDLLISEVFFFESMYCYRDKTCEQPLSVLHNSQYECEVIGNIYESPELLEGICTQK